MSEILVVSNDRVDLARMVSVMNAAGHQATGASTFEEATRLLSGCSPNLVIADERLGAFNGLHVLMRARSANPGVRAIVITPVKNRSLDADARSLDIECLVKPEKPSDWLASLSVLGQPDSVRLTSESRLMLDSTPSRNDSVRVSNF